MQTRRLEVVWCGHPRHNFSHTVISVESAKTIGKAFHVRGKTWKAMRVPRG